MPTTTVVLAVVLLAACVAAAGLPAGEAPTPRLTRSCANLDRFSPAGFRTPDSLFRPTYMWIWNDALSAERLQEQVADMAAHGAGGGLPVPEPKEFRPTWMPTRLEPDYLSPGFLERVRAVVAASRQHGVRLWLYDEGGWPSGSVCGRLVHEHPDLARRILQRAEEHPEVGATVQAPSDALAGFLCAPDAAPVRVDPGRSAAVEKPGSQWFVFRAPARGSYPDLLNPRTTDAFLAMTHDVYARAVGRDFGDTIPAMFTDEPQASAMPWTDGLADDFRGRYGYDLVDRLPALFGGETREAQQVRVDYYDWWSQRFADAYFGRIQQWCHGHGILSTGHLNGEDETLGAIKYGFGNLMRCMRRLDVPGVDVIWRQLWPGQANGDFPKHASSVAHQEGRPWALTESFAVYGSGLTPEQMKWLVDYQFARGINLVDQVGLPYSTSDWMAGGERPHFDADSPLWPWMGRFNDYVGRMGYAMSVGRSGAATALYFPVRDVWAGGAHAEKAGAAFDRAARALLEWQCDYDLIDDDVLGREGTRAEAGALAVGPMRYRTVVVPPCAWMPEASRRRLAELAAAGGKVLWLDPPEGTAMSTGAECVDESQVAGSVPRLVHTEQPAAWLRAISREAGNGTLVLLTNEGTEDRQTRLRLGVSARPYLLDPVTGTVRAIDGASEESGGWRLDVSMPFAGSVLLWCPRRTPRAAADAASRPGAVVKRLADGWTLRPDTAYEVQPTGLSRRAAGLPARPAALGDWQGPLGNAFSGTAAYETTFTCTDEEARQSAWLDLGDVRYAAQVYLNGELKGELAWRPWAVDVSGSVRSGVNTLRIVVANTMANQYVHTKALERWTAAQLGPYHPRALTFERDSLPSGLYGPVALRARG